MKTNKSNRKPASKSPTKRRVAKSAEASDSSCDLLLGAHMSIAGGADKAIDRAVSIGCNAMQIFVKNNMQWFATPFIENDIRVFCDHAERSKLKSIFGHSGYLINLAATNAEFHEKSVRSLREELIRANQLQLPFLVLHPGAHMGAGMEAGLQKVVSSLDIIFKDLPKLKTRIALETTAGQGSSMGHTFEQLEFIIQNCKESERLCVCVDTAHLFAAGYDISTAKGAQQVFENFGTCLGWNCLVALHCNDSKTGLNSRVDRHEAIGHGKIGLEAFRYIMCDPRFKNIPKVLETPKGKDLAEDVENMIILRSLMSSNRSCIK